jgi:hypothetical protein
MKHAWVLALAILSAACASTPVGGASTPTGSSTIPSAALDLGDWRHATPAATLSAFESNVSSRYGEGLALSAVSADLRRNNFNCAANHDSVGRGDPPDQVCRKTVTDNGCTHTWQVHLFDQDNNGHLARTRGLYDRRCGGDGLLGGPG